MEEESIMRQLSTEIESHFCAEDANGTMWIFRDHSVTLFPPWLEQKPIVEHWEFQYDELVPTCEHLFVVLDDKTAQCMPFSCNWRGPPARTATWCRKCGISLPSRGPTQSTPTSVSLWKCTAWKSTGGRSGGPWPQCSACSTEPPRGTAALAMRPLTRLSQRWLLARGFRWTRASIT